MFTLDAGLSPFQLACEGYTGPTRERGWHRVSIADLTGSGRGEILEISLSGVIASVWTRATMSLGRTFIFRPSGVSAFRRLIHE